MQTPWWITIAAAVAGGLIALLATVLTSILAAVISGRRQRLELAHARSLEREKLLYSHRIPLYLEIQKLIDEIDMDLRSFRGDCEALKSIFLPDTLKERAHSISVKVDRLESNLNTVLVVSDLAVAEAFMSFCEEVRSEIKSLRVGDLESNRELSPPDPSGKRRFLPKRANLYDELVDSIRREVGSRTEALDGRLPRYVVAN